MENEKPQATESAVRRRRRDDDELGRLRQYLVDNHHRNTLTVEEMAQGIGVHIRTLQRLVNESTGRTPSRYLRDFRLERASQLLLEGHSVTDVALQVGFKNPAHFSTRFREHFDLPPTAYVNRHR